MQELDQSFLQPLVKHPEYKYVVRDRDRTWASRHDRVVGRVLYHRAS